MKNPIILPTERGLYVPLGDFYIDPFRPVSRAVITHAHSDHARRGSGAYLCSETTAPLLKARLGKVSIQSLAWGEQISLGSVRVSLHPAGHILGSAQVRMEYRGYVFVVTGDYKRDPDPTAEPWEAVRAHAVLSECTFGLPLYRWPNSEGVFSEIASWWAACQANGKHAILFAYSLGKAQRLLAGLPAFGPRYVHPSIARMCQAYEAQGIALGPWRPLSREAPILPGALILMPPPIDPQRLEALAPYEIGQASGWLLLRKHRRTPHLQRAFVLSDHADFYQLIDSLSATGAETLYFTHGYGEAMQTYFAARGYESYIWAHDRPQEPILFSPPADFESDGSAGGPPSDYTDGQLFIGSSA